MGTCIEVDAGDVAHWTPAWMTFFKYPDRIQIKQMRLVDAEQCKYCASAIVGDCRICGGTEYPF